MKRKYYVTGKRFIRDLSSDKMLLIGVSFGSKASRLKDHSTFLTGSALVAMAMHSTYAPLTQMKKSHSKTTTKQL